MTTRFGENHFSILLPQFSLISNITSIHDFFYLKKTVEYFWNDLKEKGHIHKTSFSGWYCIPDETFLTEHQVTEVEGQKLSLESGHPVEWCCEENYVFKMEQFKEPIKNWLDKNNTITPSVFRNHLQMFLDQGNN